MMKIPPVIRVIVGLFPFAVWVSASQAQTCNPNIPLQTPDADFTDHGDGTVTHHKTGLMWMKCLLGQSGPDCATAGSHNDYSWQPALVIADGYSFAGYSDWRLPNIKELASIAETACYDPAINLSIFPGDPGSNVWSSSPDANYSKYAWVLSFGYGGDGPNDKGNSYRFRLVRGGQ
jgi:hypothetical protein